ncbi:MAG: hypothetical protein ABFE07_02505 [Armatimonadia bacterium]
MDSDVRGSEEARSEGARAEQARSEKRTDENWEETRRLEGSRDRDEVYAHRVTYDPGPSGTAVAGLIIGLIALAVAMYAAFAPRETVREGSQAVTTAWEQTVDAERSKPQPAAQSARQERGVSASEIHTVVASEVQKEVASMKAELVKLRSDIARGDQTKPASQK